MNKIASNFIWRLMEKWGTQGITLIVSMVLARLLDPETYGTVAIVTVITSLLSLVIDGGFGMALIQKKDSDDLDFSTVFYFNVVVCLILYLIMFLAAPLIEDFYNISQLTSIIRVQSLILIVAGIRSIQQAYVSKYMQFKKFFFSTIGGTIGAAIVGIYMAYKGYGVWALVCQSLFNNILGTIILWCTVEWRPKKIFSFERLKVLFSYGYKLLLSNLMYTGYADLRQLIIGKVYSSSDLAFYNRGSVIPNLINSGIANSLGSVLFPVMSERQDNKEKIKSLLKWSNQMYSYVLTPLLIGLCVCSEPLIVLMFSERWLPAVPYLRILSLVYVLEGIGLSNQNAMKALGRSDITLKIETIKTPLYIAILLVTIPFGVKGVAIGVVVGTYIGELICAFPSKKVFGYSLMQQLKDISPFLLLSFVMGICVSLIGCLGLNSVFMLCIQVIAGVTVYVGGSVLLKFEQFYYILNLLMSIKKKK